MVERFIPRRVRQNGFNLTTGIQHIFASSCQTPSQAKIHCDPVMPSHSAEPQPAAENDSAHHSSDGESHPEEPAEPLVLPERARWSEAELAILNEYLPRYKLKNKAERKAVLSTKILPKLKLIFKDKNWASRKQVSFKLVGCIRYSDLHKAGKILVQQPCPS